MFPTGQEQPSSPDPTAASSHEGRNAPPSGYVFKIAQTGDELIQAFHLLYHEYRNAGYAAESPSRLLFTKHHLLPATTVFLAMAEDTVLSTATSVRDSEAFGLPMDDVFQRELDELRNQRRTILEVSSLASDRRRISSDRVRHFVTLVYAHSLYQDVDDICIMVNPRHVRLYKTLFGFGVFGGERHYPRVNAPAVALRVDVREARKRFRTENTDGFPDAFSCRGISLCARLRDALDGSAGEAGGSNPLDSALARRIIAGRTAEFASLTPQCRSLIARLYPDVSLDRA